MKQLEDMSDEELFNLRDETELLCDHYNYNQATYLEQLDEIQDEITRRDEKCEQ